ncbi:DNA adenine methylase [Chitinimonas koreensis]|uniref:DNA adenine methylase n=1 Tax=Chitinimonas koreensis TaxID=356302 RepID=UPI000414FEB9|nr:DNA adenine methylase [Chitinimonas koreensis]QNM98679.1 DNA adenine methylase [Chitinimonas koreensis]
MSYLGSKAASGAYQAIIASMPPHDTYIETHLGGGAVMLRKPRAARSIGVDLDGHAIHAFRAELDDSHSIELHECDAVGFLQRFDYDDAGRVLIYADPPYLHSTRTSLKRYRCEYTSADHECLLFELRERAAAGAAVMVSGYPSALYDSLLPDWRTLEFQVMTRGGPRTEKLWMSFDPAAAHWATYAGRDFTDRQRIKRKAARWAADYAKLPAAERVAVLAALLQADAA